jgi:hypothetical protein
MKTGVDRGFCFSFWSLSDRRRFVRTLWSGPLLLLFLLLVPDLFFGIGGGTSAPERALRWSWFGFCALTQLLFAAQLVYYDRRWRSSKAVGALD